MTMVFTSEPVGICHSRRKFLGAGGGGLGTLALSCLWPNAPLPQLAAEETFHQQSVTPLRPLQLAARAKRCIYIYLEGGPSQMDLFDPKPRLNQMHGQALPSSMLENMQFAFIQKEGARLLGSPRTFRRHGESGMEFSDLLPHLATCADDIAMIRSMHTDQFNHVPGQLMMNTGSPIMGRPSLGSWMCYGLGSESQNLPAFVSLVTVGRGIPGGSASWSSGFLPSNYSGVQLQSHGDPILNLANPPGIDISRQQATLRGINDLNQLHYEETRDTELASRMKAYELAFRMQAAAPELVDISDESSHTLEAYGLERYEPPITSNRGGVGVYGAFSKNCLLARRMIERGVRVVGIFHSSWDHHTNLERELPHNARMVDQPIAALLHDLKQRGLLDETLVVWSSEFGRTALGENRPGSKVSGRDHHPLAFTLWMAGGGVRGGQTYGETDEIAWNVTRDPVHVHDLHATILHLFGIDHTRLTYRFQGRDFRLTDVQGNVVQGLIA